MRRLLGSVLPALLLVIGLGGCGDDSGSVADDPEGTSPSAQGDGKTAGTVDFDLVDTVTVTAAGGTLSTAAVPLGEDAQLEEFLTQFTSDDMVSQLEAAVAKTEVPQDQELYGAVVSIGCDAPDQVTVTDTGQDLVITAKAVPSPLPECFAPMTTVALVLVPDSVVS
jgi:hypothetical protein